jgi:putative ABC transport system permease protein
VLVDKNADIHKLEKGLNGLVASNRKGDNITKSNFILQPFKKIHFNSDGIDNSEGTNGNIMYIYVFSIVAIFVLLIACINYMNLTTARFSNRAKEIAVRKVAGAGRKSLISQFLTEAMVITLMATVLAIALVILFLPLFNDFAEKQLSLGIHTDYRIWVGIAGIVLLVGLLSGAYPALIQSALKPLMLLKNKINPGKGSMSIRQTLVVFQFAISIIMIVATLVVYLQLKYMNGKDLGFTKDQLLVVDINSGAVRRGNETIKAEFGKLSAVKNVTVSSRVPGEWKFIPKVKVKKQEHANKEADEMYFIGADDQFLKTFEISLLNGRNFLPGLGDSSAVIINEAAARVLGITNPSEQIIEIPSANYVGSIEVLEAPFRVRIIGIVKDFNFRSLREPVAPMVIAFRRNPVHQIDYFTARVSAANMPATIEQMEKILQGIDRSHLFEYHFLDKQWDLFYQEDQRRQTIFIAMAIMTILIACLGLFGLATYAAEQRIKEIGVRKVLGASVTSIVSMLSKDFLRLVLIASVIAIPAGWWFMHTWLKDFAYRINLSWWVFAGAGIIALLIALCTVSFQAIRAATANPVKSLRTE